VNLILYGPPGVGKTTVGRLAAARLGRDFVDLDDLIASRWTRPIPDYFAAGEEPLFRAREIEAVRAVTARDDLVIAPGGGAMLSPRSRAALEGSGFVVVLQAPLATLLRRLNGSAERPLLAGDAPERLGRLLAERDPLYRSFAEQVDTDGRAPEVVAAEVVTRFEAAGGVVRFRVGEQWALYGPGLLDRLPSLLAEAGLQPPMVVISDSNVAAVHGRRVAERLDAPLVEFPAGEASKTLDTVRGLYQAVLSHGMERGGTLVALGGGVAGDVAGFVAATLLRGLAWANLPTSVLAMSDAALGGKVGVDLPEGKNLVGAFHPPRLVVADAEFLDTLPEVEVRCGLAEVIKSAIIGDADLFERLERGRAELEAGIVRAAAVKVGVVNADPFEHGERASLNLGHTIGHGLEAASGYVLRHGEAIAVGLVAEARLAERAGLAEPGLAVRIEAVLRRAGLPVRAPGVPTAEVRARMASDKKKAGGRLRFALPRRMGEVAWGLEVDDSLIQDALEAITDDQAR
jgi:3-dehydroquinate synthase